MACCESGPVAAAPGKSDGDYGGVTDAGEAYEGFLEDAVKAEWDDELE